METMRFLMVTTHYPPLAVGGDAIFVESLSRELAARGHEVHVLFNPAVHTLVKKGIGTTYREETSDTVIRHEHRPSARVVNALLAYSFGRNPSAEDELNRIVRKFGIDVVNWHNTKAFFGVPSTNARLRYLYTAHDYFSVCPRSNLTRPDKSYCEDPRFCQMCLLRWKRPPQFWRVGAHRSFKFPSDLKIICPSEFMARRLRKDGIRVASVLRTFVPDPGTEYIGRPESSSRITYVGVLEEHKGVSNLVEAFSDSRNEHGFSLTIIGDGTLRESIIQRVRKLELENRIEVTGFLTKKKMREYVKDSAALVIPSQWPENAPAVVLEAFAQGIPVIGTDVGGLPEVLLESNAALIVPPGRSGRLSEAILQLWSNSSMRRVMGRRAREHFENHASIESYQSRYFGIINCPTGSGDTGHTNASLAGHSVVIGDDFGN